MLICKTYHLALTPDGRSLVYVENTLEDVRLEDRWSSVVQLLDAETLKIRHTLELPESRINSVACSNDSTQVALGSGWFYTHDSEMHPWSTFMDPYVWLLHLPEGDRVTQMKVEIEAQGVAFSTQHLGILQHSEFGIRPLTNLHEEQIAAHRIQELHVALSPAGDLLVSDTLERHGVWRWRIEPDRVRREGLTIASGRGPVAFSPDGRLLVCCGGKGLWLYDAKSWQLVREIETPRAEIAIVFDPSCRRIASAGTSEKSKRNRGDHCRRVYVWSAEDGCLIWSMPGHTLNIRHLAFSPDGELLASLSADNTVRLWRAKDGEPVATCSYQGSMWGRIAFHPDGTQWACRSHDRLTVWNRNGSLRQVRDRWSGQPWFLDDGTLLAASSTTQEPLALRRGETEEIGQMSPHRLEVQGYGVAFDPDNELVAAISNKCEPGPPGLHVYRLRDGRALEIDAPPVRPALAVCGHPRQDLFATGDRDGIVRLLEGPTGQHLAEFRCSVGSPVSRLQFDAAGQLLAAGLADGRVTLLDARDGACLQTFAGQGAVCSLSFDRDSRWLAVAREGKIQLYGLPGGELERELGGWGAVVGENRSLFVAGEAGVKQYLF